MRLLPPFRDTRLFLACLLAALALLTRPLPAAAAGWTTSGTAVLTPAGTPFTIAGVNWYGFETRLGIAHGLWSQDYRVLVDRVRATGANTIRIPWSNEMWETNPRPSSNNTAGCPACAGRRSRDILALIVNYAGSVGLHVILDNHRSTGGNSAQENGLWYTSGYPERAWIRDWVSMQEWVHGIPQTLGAADTIRVNLLASDGWPIVIGYDLRNEPHTPKKAKYGDAATWGTGDGISPATNPNPNPFSPACVATSTCRDWRLAAERAADTLLGAAVARTWDAPIIFVEGVSLYPEPGGSHASGPYDGYWWGGSLLGVNGNRSNPGAPIVLNAGGSASGLGPAVTGQLVYSAHDYGPTLSGQPWFNASTCYRTGCSGSSLSDLWRAHWAHLTVAGGINPAWPGHAAYPWANTGHAPVTVAPVWLGEFGTGNSTADLASTTAGSQGQWFTALVNFVQSSLAPTATNDAGVPVSNLHWTYWALNANDSYGVLGSNWLDVALPAKVSTFLCAIQATPAAGCGSTGALPSRAP